ncbi:MAG: glutaredoxin domain-containing protein [Methanogenium sp.]|jgi:glutaredoxin
MKITVYTAAMCLSCQQLKALLKEMGVHFKELNMQELEGLTELRYYGCFEFQAPILQVGNRFFNYKELFTGDLKENVEKFLVAKQEDEFPPKVRTLDCISCGCEVGEAWGLKSIEKYNRVLCYNCMRV